MTLPSGNTVCFALSYGYQNRAYQPRWYKGGKCHLGDSCELLCEYSSVGGYKVVHMVVVWFHKAQEGTAQLHHSGMSAPQNLSASILDNSHDDIAPGICEGHNSVSSCTPVCRDGQHQCNIWCYICVGYTDASFYMAFYR